jgi:hypothetical protein
VVLAVVFLSLPWWAVWLIWPCPSSVVVVVVVIVI